MHLVTPCLSIFPFSISRRAAVGTLLAGVLAGIAAPATAIIGGEPALRGPDGVHPAPYMGSIQSEPVAGTGIPGVDRMHRCGSARIGPNLFITAAHCVATEAGEAPPRLIWFGDPDLVQPGRSANIVGHVGLLYPSLQADGLALIVVDRAPGREHSRILRIARPDMLSTGADARLFGWGAHATDMTTTAGTSETQLRKLNLRIEDFDSTMAFYRQSGRDSTMVALLMALGVSPSVPPMANPFLAVGAPPDYRQSACFGDSGGPIVVYDSLGQPRLAGNVSGGTGDQCADIDPGPFLMNNVVFGYRELMRRLITSGLVSMASYGQTPDQRRIGAWLDASLPQANAATQAAIGHLLLDEAPDVARNLEQLAPSSLAPHARTSRSLADLLARAPSDRLAAWRDAGAAGLRGQLAQAPVDPGAPVVATDTSPPVSDAARHDAQLLRDMRARWDAALGLHTGLQLDTRLLRLPGIPSVRDVSITLDRRSGEPAQPGERVVGLRIGQLDGGLRGWHAAVYASQRLDAGRYLSADAAWIQHSSQTSRTLQLGNAETETVTADLFTRVWRIGIEAGQRLAQDADDAARGWQLTPYLRADLLRHASDDYQERGATPLTLSVRTEPWWRIGARAGLRGTAQLALANHWWLRPAFDLALARNVAQRGGSYDARLRDLDCTSAACTLSGEATPSDGGLRDAVDMQLSLALHRGQHAEFTLAARGRPLASAEQRATEWMLGMRLRW